MGREGPPLKRQATTGGETANGISSMLNKLTFGFFGPTQGEEEPKVTGDEPIYDEELQVECTHCRKMVSTRILDSHEADCSIGDTIDRQPTTYPNLRSSLEGTQPRAERQSFVMIETTPIKSNRAVDQDEGVRGGSDLKNYAMAPLQTRNTHISQTNFVTRK